MATDVIMNLFSAFMVNVFFVSLLACLYIRANITQTSEIISHSPRIYFTSRADNLLNFSVWTQRAHKKDFLFLNRKIPILS